MCAWPRRVCAVLGQGAAGDPRALARKHRRATGHLSSVGRGSVGAAAPVCVRGAAATRYHLVCSYGHLGQSTARFGQQQRVSGASGFSVFFRNPSHGNPSNQVAAKSRKPAERPATRRRVRHMLFLLKWPCSAQARHFAVGSFPGEQLLGSFWVTCALLLPPASALGVNSWNLFSWPFCESGVGKQGRVFLCACSEAVSLPKHERREAPGPRRPGTSIPRPAVPAGPMIVQVSGLRPQLARSLV